MNAKNGRSAMASVKRKTLGKTDWKRVRATKDAEIAYTQDAPKTKPEDWAQAAAHRGLPLPSRKEQIALRVDADVLAWYRAQGRGYQTRINAVLRAFRDASV